MLALHHNHPEGGGGGAFDVLHMKHPGLNLSVYL